MSVSLSILMITKNSDELLEQSLSSISNLADEIVIVDDFSTDKTLSIVAQFGATVIQRHDIDLGSQRSFGLKKCKGDWVLMLDADEIVSDNLHSEIASSLENRASRNDIYGFYIPYQNHLFGKPIYYGGENYKILRLFKRNSAVIKSNLIHEYVEVKEQTDYLNNKVFHYSYRTPIQIIQKFTDYAKREAKKKAQNSEKSSLRKLILYPLHIIWARYIKDQGYKDGFVRLFLDLSFGYMEFCTYFFLIFEKREQYINSDNNPTNHTYYASDNK